ncbi:5' exonuclease Apollo [Sesamum angolense]|uniref:5' exonuclease Apollo n=1 Tax=Sesamum angolense TaxID=2727404 RepID=A0AAE1WIG4_9LAMI|nr:5' exonuclease Apollo [Sesamum angolense]
MPIEMPRGLPFSVDTWTPCSKRKRHHFLTHAHKDHAQGMAAHASYPIYSTLLTKTLIFHYYTQLDGSMFVGIEVGQSLIVEDPDGDFTVTAFDANHCPGAVMFLFEGNFGNILHTGDCRLTPECLQSLPDKYIGKTGKQPMCPLDYIFLDCTFGQFPLKMPSRYTAIQQVINCIWKHPDARTVYLTCDLLGQEEILVQVAQTFGEKIFVDKANNLECFKSLKLIVPEIISEDPSSRFQLLDGFPKLYERAEAKIAEALAHFRPEPLIIRPSSQWYACDEGHFETEKWRKERFDQAVRDPYGVWHICYSIHSSRDELEWALQLLAPKWVVSTTPSCRAMELDYVKTNCFNNQQAFSRSLQKLLDISAVASLGPDELEKSMSCSHVVENISISCAETRSEPVVISTRQRKRLSLSPPSKRRMITLFGRARLGLCDSTFQHESDSMERVSIETKHVSSKKEDVAELKLEQLHKTMKKTDFAEIENTSEHINIENKKVDVFSPISLSNGYNGNLRRFYRSMNVPVPQRLPSLVALMDAKRSAKKRM